MRQPSRESKKGINYKGRFALFGKQENINEEITSSIVESYCAYLSTFYLNGQGLLLHRKHEYIKESRTCQLIAHMKSRTPLIEDDEPITGENALETLHFIQTQSAKKVTIGLSKRTPSSNSNLDL